MTIPNIIHFIDVGGREFSFTHYLVILSAHEVNKPDHIYLHCDKEPAGRWWEAIKAHVDVVRRTIPSEVFGHTLAYRAHQSDVMRLEILLEYGGIYLDLDAMSINSFAPLLGYAVVMGREPESGLGSGVILAEKNADFLKIWQDAYRTYDGSSWNYHSVKLPWELSLRYPALIHVVDPYAFYYPKYNDPSSAYLWGVPIRGRMKMFMRNLLLNSTIFVLKHLHLAEYDYRHPPIAHLVRGREWQFEKLRQTYSLHLYESTWEKEFLRYVTPESIFDPEHVKYECNFSRLMRTVFPSLPL